MALVMIAGIPALWVIFWGALFVLADPITWVLYSAGEYAEKRGWA